MQNHVVPESRNVLSADLTSGDDLCFRRLVQAKGMPSTRINNNFLRDAFPPLENRAILH